MTRLWTGFAAWLEAAPFQTHGCHLNVESGGRKQSLIPNVVKPLEGVEMAQVIVGEGNR